QGNTYVTFPLMAGQPQPGNADVDHQQQGDENRFGSQLDDTGHEDEATAAIQQLVCPDVCPEQGTQRKGESDGCLHGKLCGMDANGTGKIVVDKSRRKQSGQRQFIIPDGYESVEIQIAYGSCASP